MGAIAGMARSYNLPTGLGIGLRKQAGSHKTCVRSEETSAKAC
jgi:hypothetical protein